MAYRSPWTMDMDVRLIALIKLGLGSPDIAHDLGLTPSAITSRAARLGMRCQRKNANNDNFTRMPGPLMLPEQIVEAYGDRRYQDQPGLARAARILRIVSAYAEPIGRMSSAAWATE